MKNKEKKHNNNAKLDDFSADMRPDKSMVKISYRNQWNYCNTLECIQQNKYPAVALKETVGHQIVCRYNYRKLRIYF